MANDLEYHNCPVCFIYYAAPEALFTARRKDGQPFYCPNGHRLSYNDSEFDKIRRERDRLKQNQAWYEERYKETENRLDEQKRQLSAARGQITKLSNRASAGVCPCCNRQFKNMHRHMQSKHPTFRAEMVQ